MKTLAAVLYETNKELRIEELAIPELKPGQVLVRIAYSGICHTQLNEIKGLKGEDKFLPHTLGHEGSGVVMEVGPDVHKVKSGDHVVLTWIKGRGLDIPATSYRDKNGAIVNSGAISTIMKYAIISENRLVAVNKKMPLKEAALLGCAIPTGAGIVLNTLDLSGDKSVAIFGMGGIGLSSLLAAKIKGASIIVGIDISEERLKLARSLGATHTLNAKNVDLLKALMEITDNKGLDYAVESAGNKEAMEVSFRSVRDKGGLSVIAGNLPVGETIRLDPFDLIKGKRLIGTWGGDTLPDKDIPVYVDWVISGKLELDKLINRVYELKDINKAVACMEEDAVGRVLIGCGC